MYPGQTYITPDSNIFISKIAHCLKKGCELRAKLLKMLAIRKKSNATNQRRIQNYRKIQNGDLFGRIRWLEVVNFCHKDLPHKSCSSPRYAFVINTRNDGTKLSAKFHLQRKEQSSIEKRQFMKLTGFCVARALNKKDVVSRL